MSAWLPLNVLSLLHNIASIQTLRVTLKKRLRNKLVLCSLGRGYNVCVFKLKCSLFLCTNYMSTENTNNKLLIRVLGQQNTEY